MSSSKTLAIILFLIGLVLVIVPYFILEKLPEIQRDKVAKRLPFLEGAESTEKWRNSKDKGYLKIYLFNITNIDEYLSDEENSDQVIQVQEVGPIVYSYVPNITVLNWTNNENEIKYVKARSFHLEPEMSKIDLDTPINSVNIIVASILDKVNGYNYFKRLIADPVVNTNMKKFNATPFHTKTVDEILFRGYDISILPQVNSEAAAKYPDNLYGLMYNKNHSHDGIYTMNTGKDNITRLGEIEKWDEISLNNCWKDSTEKCGHVVGTDGTRFHPGLDRNNADKVVNLYSSSLFRSLSMTYKNDYIFKGIKVSRYELEEKNFDLQSEENKCYCPDKEKTLNGEPMCNFNGLLDISNCRQAPIIISAPHFLYGSPKILDHIKGIKPNLTEHGSFIDIDPVTGIVLKGRKRLQINVYVRKHKYGHKNKDSVVPVMWIEEGQDITDEKSVLYYKAIYGLIDKATYFLLGCIIVGTILIVSALGITSINIIRSSFNDKFIVENKNKKSDINHNLKYHKAELYDKAQTMPMDEKIKMTTTEK